MSHSRYYGEDMPTRVENLIVDIRDILSDEGERWSDARIIRAIDTAQKRTVNKYKILFGEAYLKLTDDILIYRLPDEAILLKKVLYLGEPIPLVTEHMLDLPEGSILPQKWETCKGTEPRAIVIDCSNRLNIRIFPIIEKLVPIASNFNSPFGTVVDFSVFETDQIVFDNTVFGFITNVTDEESITVRYEKRPSTITSINSVLEVDPIVDIGLKHYAAGEIFRSDLDAQNRAMANEEFILYTSEMNELEEARAFDFADTGELTSMYRGFQ